MHALTDLHADVVGYGQKDVHFSCDGKLLVADYFNCRVCVFDWSSGERLHAWGFEGTRDGQFMRPTAVSIAGPHLYVMDASRLSSRLQVFE